MEVKKEETKALEVTYRIEPMKTIEVTKEHSDRTARARTLAILRSSLFGRKRYQDIYITCSLNNLFNALRIAEFMHRRVPDLSMIISMPPLKIIEVYIDPEKPNDPSHKVTERKRIQIKLTRQPTEEDRQRPGYNAGFAKENIKDPIEDLNFKGEGNQGQRRRRDDEGRRSNKTEPRREKKRTDSRRDRDQNRDRDRDRRGGQERAHRDRRQREERAKDFGDRKYRRANDEQLEDEAEYRRSENKRTRGGKTSSSRRQEVQTEHNYKKEHMNRDQR